LSQKAYIKKVLERYGMQDCKLGDTPVTKGDKFSLSPYPKNDLEVKEMQKISYASGVESLMYAQVYTRSDIAFIVEMLGRYLSNPRMDHCEQLKGSSDIYRELRITCSHTKGQIRLRSLGIRILTLLDAKTVEDAHQATFIC